MSTPSLDPDDPRLTAYALGEADKSDLQAVEAFLADSVEGRTEVEQTREIARVLAAEYAHERDHYLATRLEGEPPSNVVAFTSGRSRAWRHATVLTLKIAAVAALSASLVYLTLRRPRHSEITTIASVPAGRMSPAPTPGLLAADQFAKDKASVARGQERSDTGQATVADDLRRGSPETAAVVPAGSSTDTQVAMDRSEANDQIAETAAGGQAAGTFSSTATAPPPFARDGAQSKPSAASPVAPAASGPSEPSSSDEQITRSLVRIRTAAGAFFGGVLVSADGFILAITSLPESSLQPPCVVLLADQRELPTVAKPARTSSGWYRLRIGAKALPAAVLAKESPSDDTPLAIASVDPRTGATTISRVSASDADSSRRANRLKSEGSMRANTDATFAFNALGELLVIDRPAEQPHDAELARTRAGSPKASKRLARPFTDAERKMLPQAAKRDGHQ